MKETVSIEIGGSQIEFETGYLAKQAGGSVVVRQGETVVLCAVTASKNPVTMSYFPLSVHYLERYYAAGKIPGGFIKREGKPSTREVLTSRLIDRPIRPLFPDGFMHEVQIMPYTLSYDNINQPDILALNGSSMALMLSNIPFNGPIGAVRVGMIDGEYITNPSPEQCKQSEINIVVAGTKNGILMVEGEAKFVSEAHMIGAIQFAHSSIVKLCDLQIEFAEKFGKEKIAVESPAVDAALVQEIRSIALSKYQEALTKHDKAERSEFVDAFCKEIIEQSIEKYKDTDGFDEGELKKSLGVIFEELEAETIRTQVIEKGIRADGRKCDQIRPIDIEINVLPRTHGSSIFTRGQTQALNICTLGTVRDDQMVDNIAEDESKKFFLHYNFPAFSVGETRRVGPVGRREIGHGDLAERSLLPVLPDFDTFPYTMRVVSEVLESNGSSSMATVCSTSLSLMAAGVPVTDSIAGIAMGLIIQDGKDAILTDILGIEDHHGDMDFKVAGSRAGITGFQMDLKIDSISFDIMERALAQAHTARLFILDKMDAVISKPVESISKYAPRIASTQIPTDKIREVIGSGGKVINKIIELTETEINIDDDGLVTVASKGDPEGVDKALDIVREIIRGVKVGEIYHGRVARIDDRMGLFISLGFTGKDGLMRPENMPEDADAMDALRNCSVGYELDVKVIEIDKMGRINIGHKDIDIDAYIKRKREYRNNRPSRGGYSDTRRSGGRDDRRRR